MKHLDECLEFRHALAPDQGGVAFRREFGSSRSRGVASPVDRRWRCTESRPEALADPPSVRRILTPGDITLRARGRRRPYWVGARGRRTRGVARRASRGAAQHEEGSSVCGGASPEVRAQLLERRSFSVHLTDQFVDTVAATTGSGRASPSPAAIRARRALRSALSRVASGAAGMPRRPRRPAWQRSRCSKSSSGRRAPGWHYGVASSIRMNREDTEGAFRFGRTCHRAREGTRRCRGARLFPQQHLARLMLSAATHRSARS